MAAQLDNQVSTVTNKYDVLSYGTIGMDVVLSVPHWPHPDISTHSASATEALGGKASNAAVHLAKWGLSVAVTGTIIGEDDFGQRILAALTKIPSLATRFVVQQSGIQSMYCIILVRSDGERAIVGVHTDSIVATPPSSEMMSSARLLTLDLYGGDERVQAARLAKEAGIPVVVGDVRRLDHDVLPHTTIAIASAAELRREYPGLSADDCARRLVEAGAGGVVITGGAGMVLVLGDNNPALRFNPPQVIPVDTTGAGDAFRAGIIYGMLAGFSLAKSAMIGAAAGSLAVRRLGAATDPASIEQVLQVAEGLVFQ
jgi:sugar/nucleoside kinase (ribokinase family)